MSEFQRHEGRAAPRPPQHSAATGSIEPEFRDVYDTYFNFVWRSLRRLGVREADTMDVAQKVFLTVHLRLADFEGRSQLRTWLFGICQRTASDYRRSALIRREIVTDAAELDIRRQDEEVPSTTKEYQRRNAVAESILAKLPEPQRLVFVLFELEEMSGDDIAELLNLSVGTVRSRLRLARDKFRREVKRLSAAEAGELKEAM